MRTHSYLTALAAGILFAGIAAAQPIGGGLKLGGAFTDAFSVTSFNPLSYVGGAHRFVVGPYLDVRLPGHFGAEFDILYRSFDFGSSQGGVSAGLWEFPVMAKYKFGSGPVKPYVEGGLVLSHLSVKDVVELTHRSNYGATLGAGVDLHLLLLHVMPEIRYEGFAFRNITGIGDALLSNRNQVLFTVGV